MFDLQVRIFFDLQVRTFFDPQVKTFFDPQVRTILILFEYCVRKVTLYLNV